MHTLEKVNLAAAFASFSEQWSPRIAGDLNGQHIKIAKIKGEFVWHHHDDADEMFMVHKGRFVMELRDRRIELAAGEFFIVPRGVEHRPVADEECEIILFEPAGTVNTGNAHDDARTISQPERLA